MSTFNRLADKIIREAMAEGKFNSLPKKGAVDHSFYDTTSILRFITRLHDLPLLEGIVERNAARSSKEIVQEMFAAVQMFCGDAPQSDDRTVVVVKINQLAPAASQKSQESIVGS